MPYRVGLVNADVTKQVCSQYQHGLSTFACLQSSKLAELVYIDSGQAPPSIDLFVDLDAVIFNYHPYTLGLSQEYVRSIPQKKFILSYERCWDSDPWVIQPGAFDASCFDYTIFPWPDLQTSDDRVLVVPRAVDRANIPIRHIDAVNPVISTSAISMSAGTIFGEYVQRISDEFDHATLKVHLAPASFGSAVDQMASHLQSTDKVEVQLNTEVMSIPELILWLSDADATMFVYSPNRYAIPASPDQAISAQRPIIITDTPNTRHITSRVGGYPTQSMRETLERGCNPVIALYEEWSPTEWGNRFDQFLSHHGLVKE